MSLLYVPVSCPQLRKEFGALRAPECPVTFRNQIAITSAGLVINSCRLMLCHRLHDGLKEVWCLDVFILRIQWWAEDQIFRS